MTDPIADFLARVRNAILSRKTTLALPGSKLKLQIAELLKQEGFFTAVSETADGWRKTLSITLRWDAGNRPAITGLRRVSKPGQRAYVNTGKLPKVRGGLGTAVVSTSKGVMTDRQARKLGIGGEGICEVW